MKNKSLIFNSILGVSIIFGSLLNHSCSKDEISDQLDQINDQENIFTNKADNEVEEMIKNFNTDINDMHKSGISYNFDESILLMEGLFNYMYGNVNGTYIEKFVDTVIINTEFNKQDEVPAVQLLQFYLEINLSIYNAFQECEYPNKKVKCIDLLLNETEGQLIAYTIIGNRENKKNGMAGAPPIKVITWPGETPFNNQQGQYWRCVADWDIPGYIFHYYTEVAIALRQELAIHKDPPTSRYWTNITTKYASHLTDGSEYSDYYQYDPDISSDIIQNYNPNIPSTFYFAFYGTWDYNYHWYEEEADDYYVYRVDYKQMNKLYNSCKIFMQYYDPDGAGRIEIIDFDFATWQYQEWVPDGFPFTEAYAAPFFTYGKSRKGVPVPTDPRL